VLAQIDPGAHGIQNSERFAPGIHAPGDVVDDHRRERGIGVMLEERLGQYAYVGEMCTCHHRARM
jgi:hypothetical protein